MARPSIKELTSQLEALREELITLRQKHEIVMKMQAPSTAKISALSAERDELKKKNAELTAKLQAQPIARGTMYLSMRPEFKRAVDKLSKQHPERKSFTQQEVLDAIGTT